VTFEGGGGAIGLERGALVDWFENALNDASNSFWHPAARLARAVPSRWMNMLSKASRMRKMMVCGVLGPTPTGRTSCDVPWARQKLTRPPWRHVMARVPG
jgi:hypothetical protein